MRGRGYESVTSNVFRFSNFIKNVTGTLAARSISFVSPENTTAIANNSIGTAAKTLALRSHPDRFKSADSLDVSKNLFEYYRNKNMVEKFIFSQVQNQVSVFNKTYEPKIVWAKLTNPKESLMPQNDNAFVPRHMFFSFRDPVTRHVVMIGPFTHGSPWIFDKNNLASQYYLYPIIKYSDKDFMGMPKVQNYVNREWVSDANVITLFEDHISRIATERFINEEPRVLINFVFYPRLAIWLNPPNAMYTKVSNTDWVCPAIDGSGNRRIIYSPSAKNLGNFNSNFSQVFEEGKNATAVVTYIGRDKNGKIEETVWPEG